MPPAILACFAHPDDEIFGTGGAFAHYADQGTPVYLVCATRGDAGEVSDPALLNGGTLAELRTRELRCATRTLGINAPIFLDYGDSGMAGMPENGNPAAYINAPAEEVVRKLVAIVRDVQPGAVVTFDHMGGYGHPDHVAMHRHTVAAFHAAADARFAPELGPAWQADRLFYRAMARSQLTQLRTTYESLGLSTRFFDYHEEHGLTWEDEAISLVMDVSATAARKRRAYLCHASQFGPDHPFRRAPEHVTVELMGREYFVLAYPEQATTPLRGLLE